MKKIMTLVCAGFLLSACQKEIESLNGNGATSGGTTSGSTGGGTTTGSADYQPVTTASKWNMKSTSIGDYSMTSLGTDTTINNLRYYKFDHSSAGRQYISKEGGVYKQRINYAPAGGWTTLTYLKDAAVGTTWTETLSASGTSFQMKYTVAAVGGTRTVAGKAYNNVLKVTYEQSLMGMTTATGEQYYAKGVGPIEGVSRMDVFGVTTTTDSSYLVSAVIN